jgi:hypothetical protein
MALSYKRKRINRLCLQYYNSHNLWQLSYKRKRINRLCLQYYNIHNLWQLSYKRKRMNRVCLQYCKRKQDILFFFFFLHHFDFKKIQVAQFLADLSWKLKWAFLIACRPSSVCPSVLRLSVRLLHFQLLQNCWANFNQSWHRLSLGKGSSELYKWRKPPFPRGDNSERVKIHWKFFLKFSGEPAGQFQSNLIQIILR